MYKKNETIAAIATGLSDSGISIIRVSGGQAFNIVDKVFKNSSGIPLSECDTHTIHYGYIVNKHFSGKLEEDGLNGHLLSVKTGMIENEIIDEVMVSVFKKPRSYTTEDTVEINCHGGVMITRKVLQLVLNAGASLAEPGEFTKRAFLNGRIDLSKAEAVMDIIHAKNDFALKSSINLIRGKLSKVIKSLREKILYEIAFIESALDDPEHISLDGYYEKLSKTNREIINQVQHLIKSCDNGRILKEGISTVIVGKPNAGKSSLLNILVGADKAIVTDIAGTTRDVIEEHITLSGISLNIIDTAGIRNTDDMVEQIGVDRALAAADKADLIIYVIDSSIPLDENDRNIIELVKDKKMIILLNKSDLPPIVTEEDVRRELSCILDKENCLSKSTDNEVSSDTLSLCRNRINPKMIKISALANSGIDLLTNEIKELFFSGDIKINDEVILSNMRQKEAVLDALKSLLMVQQSIDDEMPEDFLSIDLMGAYAALGYVIGEEVGEDLVNEIFSKFCMGK